MREVTKLVVVFLAVSAILAPAAAAQLFLDPADRRIALTPGDTTTTSISITNPANRSYVVQAGVTGNLSDEAEITPKRFPIEKRATSNVTLAVTPPEDTEFTEGGLSARFTFIDRETGAPIVQTVQLTLTVERDPLFLGLFDNPLPAPYTSSTWLFALELASWAGLSILLAGAMGTAMTTIVPRASDEVQQIMAGKVRWPIFFTPLILGVDFSWRLLPDGPALSAISSLLDALSIVIVAVVAYRVISAGLVHYGENVAQKTETKVDDVLVPVLEKLGAAAIVAFAGFYAFKALGVDFSFLVAGGLVAGLVISMAAQDTLSNFFSGLHLLIDRPFREGDVIQLETGEICRVDDIGLRSTNLYHFQKHQEIIAPNNEVATKRIVNMSYPDRHYRLPVPVSVAYGTDLEEAMSLLYQVAMETEEVLKGRNTKPRVFVKEFGESSIQLELRAFLPDERARNPARTSIIQDVHTAFREAGIEIPFPQRVVHMREEGSDQRKAPQVLPTPPQDGENTPNDA